MIARIEFTGASAPAARRVSGFARLLILCVAAVLGAVMGLGSPAIAQSGKGGLPGGIDPLKGLGAESGPVVKLTAQCSKLLAMAEDKIIFVVEMDFAEGWHAWPSAAQDVLPPDVKAFALPTTVSIVNPPDWLMVGPVQWPQPKPTHVAGMPDPVPTYGGKARVYISAYILPSVTIGPKTITIRVSLQACNDTTCEPPITQDLPVEIHIASNPNTRYRDIPGALGSPAPGGLGGPGPGGADEPGDGLDEVPGGLAQEIDPEIFSGFDSTVFADMSKFGTGTIEPEPYAARTEKKRTFFGIAIPSPTDPLGIAIVALLAALGGAILNLTPCVLPVIPLKIMAITSHADAPGKSLVLGLWMAFGVIAFWGGLGLIAAFVSAFADPSRIFGIWWVTLGIGLLIGVMGVGILGAFEIRLPRFVYAVNPKADSPVGSFFFGVMTAVLGLPCFGFVAGALLAGSASLPWGVVLTIFVALGVGMAAPYLVLSAFPKLVKKVPRTGPASVLVKQVLGLLLLAAAAYFIGGGVIALLGGSAGLPWWGKSIHWWFVGLFSVAAGLWLIKRTISITKKPVRRLAFGLLGLFIGAVGTLAAVDRTNDAYHNIWVPYSDSALASARASGRVVLLDFTAEWCLNCKALKAAVLSQEPIKPLLQSGRVVPMTVDLTSTEGPGWDMLRGLGQTGIPLLVIYGPNTGDTPWMANNYTAGMVLEGLAEAAGVPVEKFLGGAGVTPAPAGDSNS